MAHLKIAKPSTEAEKTTRTTLDTWEITPAVAKSWRLPPFQRPLKVNKKVVDLSGQIALDGGVIPGVFCIGLLGGEQYLVDGQHRREAFLMSECKEGFVDVRVAHFSTMAEMAEEFVNLNSRLVNMRADDIIRGLESSYEPVAKLRKACPFIGYDNVRRSPSNPVVSMSTALRSWVGSAHDVPHTTGSSAASLATEFTSEESRTAVAYFECCSSAWGKDPTNYRLWGSLNLTLCAWLYRRIVVSAFSVKTTKLDSDQFTKCLMHLSADAKYVDWLVGRNITSRDIAPCYGRIKPLFSERLQVDTGKKHLLPQPGWATNAGRKGG